MSQDDPLMALIRAIAAGDARTSSALLAADASLARRALVRGATRSSPSSHFLEAIMHYVYEGDTALHVAAAAYDRAMAIDLLTRGAGIRARNRRGAEALHYAADGSPTFATWNPRAQAEIIACLIDAGADPNSRDKSGVAPLHRAVRTRCTGAVRALLAGGADARLKNKSGSMPIDLAVQTTGRGGSGSADAKREQREIVRLLQP
jgi:hypothetical protein